MTMQTPPTPWTLGDANLREAWWMLNDADGKPVARIYGDFADHALATAELIVAAVNAHNPPSDRQQRADNAAMGDDTGRS